MIIYCDMDGVLCDFNRAAAKVAGVSTINQWSKLPEKERWKPIREHGSFWETLPWKGDGRMLWNYIRKYDVHILSAYVSSMSDPNCIPGKMKWLRKNVSVSAGKIHLVKRRQKQNYAKDNKGKPNILIDDFISNINDFKRRGGIGIYHKSSSQSIAGLKKLGF